MRGGGEPARQVERGGGSRSEHDRLGVRNAGRVVPLLGSMLREMVDDG